MYKKTFIDAGLSASQAEVYEALLENGKQRAGLLTKKVSLKRGLVYKILDELEEVGLIEKEVSGDDPAEFSAKHPSILMDYVEKRARSLKNAEISLEESLPALISKFNLASGRPGVQMFEGREGVEKTLDDSLSVSKGIIYTYADIEAVKEYIPDINERYVKKRDRMNIDKKVILLDSPAARDIMKEYHRLSTDVKFIQCEAPPFKSVMEIYEGKISYVTFEDKKMIGVIIEDASIYEMHKYIFDYMWKITPSRVTDDSQ